ncbi:MAG: hypothetical protein HC914_13905 [Chloroflexaceae bacterium]|nr:hypothetical protein [Chloroflexaceae bacterium]
MQTLFDSYGGGANGDIGRPWPIVAYLRFHWRESLGPLPSLLVLVGIVALARRNPAQLAVLLAYPLLIILALLRLEVHFYRNLLPAQAPLLLLAGIGAVALWDYARPLLLQRSGPQSPRRWLLALLALLALLLPSVLPAVQASARLAQPDSRPTAQEWARQHYPGVRIAAELTHPMRWDGVAQSTFQHFLPLQTPEWYHQQGYGLLLANSGRRGGRDEWIEPYDELLAAGTVVATFGGDQSGYLGPRVDLIDIGLSSERVPAGPSAALGPLRLLTVTYGKLERDSTGQAQTTSTQMQPGDILGITAFWIIDAPVSAGDYTTFVHLRNAEGQNVTQRDAPIWMGLFPPDQWQPGHVATESLDIFIPETIPPGTYQLVAGLYNSIEGYRYPAVGAGEHLPDDELVLGTVDIIAQ